MADQDHASGAGGAVTCMPSAAARRAVVGEGDHVLLAAAGAGAVDRLPPVAIAIVTDRGVLADYRRARVDFAVCLAGVQVEVVAGR